MTKKTIEQAYEELRAIIDGGSESFTHEDAVEYLKEKLAQQSNEQVERALKKMTAHRAIYFMERFKHEEKLLGLNEQAALDFVIAMLESHPPVPTAQPKGDGINESAFLERFQQNLDRGLTAEFCQTCEALARTVMLDQSSTDAPQRKPLTDEMVLAGARALAKRHADSCGLDFDDVWKYYADEHKDDAKVVIEAAHGIKE